MPKFTYEYGKDFVLFAIADAEQKFIPCPDSGREIRKSICFRWLWEEGWQITKNPAAKYVHFWFFDSIGERSNLVASANRFVSKIRKTGLLRNTTVKVENWESVPPKVRTHHSTSLNKPRFIHVIFDVDKVSSPELFLIGNIFRTIQLHPHVVVDFLEYVRLHPDVPIWSCFLIAHTLSYKTHDAVRVSGHCVAWRHFDYVAKSAEQILEHIDTHSKGTVREKPSYSYISWDTQLTNMRGKRKTKINQYTKELFMSYLSRENQDEFLNKSVVIPEPEPTFAYSF